MDPSYINLAQAAIASGQSLSAEVDIGVYSLVGILVPANWTTAGITFQASVDGVTWGELQDTTATAISVSSVTGGAAAFIAFDPTKLRGVRALKVRSGTAGAPVSQTNAVTLTLVGRFIY